MYAANSSININPGHQCFVNVSGLRYSKQRQDFRTTPYINYAYIHCLKKTKDRTILSLWDFGYCFRNF